ncbi:MAG: response regulator [Thermodesulfobacteriota bacterium]
MKGGPVIVVADRNRRVREFIGRELAADGYVVLGAKDGKELMAMIEEGPMPDLLILDLELPYVDGLDILERLRDLELHVPVVIHTFLTEYANHPATQGAAGFLEKSGDNIHHLRATVAEVLQCRDPSRPASALVDSNGGQSG